MLLNFSRLLELLPILGPPCWAFSRAVLRRQLWRRIISLIRRQLRAMRQADPIPIPDLQAERCRLMPLRRQNEIGSLRHILAIESVRELVCTTCDLGAIPPEKCHFK